jgi:HSP20 family molecular chaperone IbpA
MLDAATRVDSASLGYPPYNIEKTGDDAYRLTMAVTGFSPDELDVTVQENSCLTVCAVPTQGSVSSSDRVALRRQAEYLDSVGRERVRREWLRVTGRD